MLQLRLRLRSRLLWIISLDIALLGIQKLNQVYYTGRLPINNQPAERYREFCIDFVLQILFGVFCK
jgi:hypothetical protein